MNPTSELVLSIADDFLECESNEHTIALLNLIKSAVQENRVFYSLDGAAIRYRITDDLAKSSFCLLPYLWSEVTKKMCPAKLSWLIERCKALDVYLVVWDSGDLERVLPFQGIIQFQNGLHRSVQRKPKFAFEVPAFWPDYLNIYFKGEQQLRRKSTKPVVGFCGQAASTVPKLAFVVARNTLRRISYAIGTSKHIPPPITPSTVLRNRVLSSLSKSLVVTTNFIIRDRYRDGVRSKQDRDNHFHPSKMEFVKNLIESDYIVCVRGGGNFSVRLYETLSCGRIPVFIDTDSRLPFDFLIDWKQYCVWVEHSEINHAAEKIADFHSRLTDDDFIELQLKCRQLWEDWLSRDGFLLHFHEHLIHIVNSGELSRKDSLE